MDEARKWLEKTKNAAWPDEVDIVEAQSIIRRLLAKNERLTAAGDLVLDAFVAETAEQAAAIAELSRAMLEALDG